MSTKNRVNEEEVIMQQNENGELVPYQPLAPQQQAVQPYNPFGQQGQYWANFAPKTNTDKMLILKCFGEPTISANDAIGKDFALSRILVHPVTYCDDKTGEEIQLPRTVLINPDGETVAFASFGIVNSIQRLSMLFGMGPWEPPLIVRLKQIGTRRGNRTYTLELVQEQLAAAERKGRK